MDFLLAYMVYVQKFRYERRIWFPGILIRGVWKQCLHFYFSSTMCLLHDLVSGACLDWVAGSYFGFSEKEVQLALVINLLFYPQA